MSPWRWFRKEQGSLRHRPGVCEPCRLWARVPRGARKLAEEAHDTGWCG